MKHKHLIKMITLAGATLLTACNQASFDANPGTVMQQCVPGRPEVQCQVQCEEGQCFNSYDYSIRSQAQVTDILFVIDNSASMHEEQAAMSQRFPSFMQMIQDIDYRIGMITTDVTATPGNRADSTNGNGAFQDGRLLAFPDGRPFLDGTLDVGTEQTFFQRTVQRQETLNCAAFINSTQSVRDANCPSGDERGLFAAALNIQSNPSSWIRPTGHLAVVVLSDEDEGSDGLFLDSSGRDRPQGFVSHVQNRFPNKSLAVHSIIIRPGDSQCFNRQAVGPIRGSYGQAYAEATRLTDGVLGNICSSNYTDQLMDIGEAASQFREVLPCVPANNQVEVTFNPQVGNDVQVIQRLQQREILFTGNIPNNTEIRLRYRCAQ